MKWWTLVLLSSMFYAMKAAGNYKTAAVLVKDGLY